MGPCIDIDIGNGLQSPDGVLIGIFDCNLLCIGLEMYVDIVSNDQNDYGCLCDPFQNDNLGLIQCNHESAGIMVDSTYVDLYCGEFNYQNGECINPNNIIPGDITVDGSINRIDLIALFHYISQILKAHYDDNFNFSLDAETLTNSDTNNDLNIDGLDYCQILGASDIGSCQSNSYNNYIDIEFNNNIITLSELPGSINGVEFLIKHPVGFQFYLADHGIVSDYFSINDTITFGTILNNFNQPNINYELFETSSDQFSVLSMKAFNNNYLTTSLIDFPDYYGLNNIDECATDNGGCGDATCENNEGTSPTCSELFLFNGLIPEDFSIHNIYPNPFNPVTNITYGLPEHVNVQIIVYDLSGQQVATLINQFQSPGYHSVNWDADNLPSGVFLIRMDSGDFTQTQKVILVK